jgi:hypothetical protein
MSDGFCASPPSAAGFGAGFGGSGFGASTLGSGFGSGLGSSVGLGVGRGVASLRSSGLIATATAPPGRVTSPGCGVRPRAPLSRAGRSPDASASGPFAGAATWADRQGAEQHEVGDGSRRAGRSVDRLAQAAQQRADRLGAGEASRARCTRTRAGRAVGDDDARSPRRRSVARTGSARGWTVAVEGHVHA